MGNGSFSCNIDIECELPITTERRYVTAQAIKERVAQSPHSTSWQYPRRVTIYTRPEFIYEETAERVVKVERFRRAESSHHREDYRRYGGVATNGGLDFEPLDFIPTVDELDLVERLSDPDSVTMAEVVAEVYSNIPEDRADGVGDMVFQNRRNVLGIER